MIVGVRVCCNVASPASQTHQLVAGVMERARLLLSVTIATGHTPSSSSYTSIQEQKGKQTCSDRVVERDFTMH